MMIDKIEDIRYTWNDCCERKKCPKTIIPSFFKIIDPISKAKMKERNRLRER